MVALPKEEEWEIEARWIIIHKEEIREIRTSLFNSCKMLTNFLGLRIWILIQSQRVSGNRKRQEVFQLESKNLGDLYR